MNFPGNLRKGFTLLEAVISVGIFMMLMIGVGALWNTCWKASDKIIKGDSSRTTVEMALRRLNEAVGASVYHPKPALYAWVTSEARGTDLDEVSFVTSLPPDATVGLSGTAPLERILIKVKEEEGARRLVMLAAPFTMEEDQWSRETILVDGVEGFRARFWNSQSAEWMDDWREENKKPDAVQFSILMKNETAANKGDWPHTVSVQIPKSPDKEAYGEKSGTGRQGSNTNQFHNPQIGISMPGVGGEAGGGGGEGSGGGEE